MSRIFDMPSHRHHSAPHAIRFAAFVGAVVALSCALLSGPVLADSKSKAGAEKLYKWVDENGIVHYGDRVPAEYAKRERQVLNEQGVPIKTLQKELTPTEMAAELRRIEQESAQAQAAARATERDRILLLSYIDVREIEMLRDQRIATLDGQLKVNEHYVGRLRSQLLDLEGRARDYNYPFDERSALPQLPDELAKDLLATVNQLSRREAESHRIRGEQAEIRAQFDADIARFRELKPGDEPDATASSR
jgi:hypothetical protein